MKQITAIFETAEQAEMATERVQRMCSAKNVRMHRRDGHGYHENGFLSGMFVPPPRFNPGGDAAVPQPVAVHQAAESMISSVKTMVSLDVYDEKADNAAMILRNMGGSDVKVRA